jgi:putative membrane protein
MTAGSPRSVDEPARGRIDLGLDRTIMAADRTLMAWVRTALSMISFGFTIYKFLESVRTKELAERPEGPRNVGLVLIGMGVISLLLASLQYIGHLSRLGRSRSEVLRSLSLWVAVAVGLFGLLALLNIAFKVGPF